MNSWRREQQKARRKQAFEIHRCKQVRALAGAVMCETRDLGTQWPQWRHIFAEHSFNPVSSCFLITCCFIDATYCLTDATDWNQINPLCNSALVRSDVSGEHAPINLPTRNMIFRWSTTRRSPLPRTLSYLDTPELQAAASTQQQAEIPLC